MEKAKVLIVDDRRENIDVLSELIASDEIEIFSAQSGEEALSHLMKNEFALALLDVQMPGMNGFELARLIRGVNRGKHLPVIFVTASQETSEIIFEGYGSGAVDLLFKPLDASVVRSKVQTFVRLHQQNELVRLQIEELKELRQKADNANQAKSQFLANMSHEIRTPLAAVLGFADTLSDKNLSFHDREQSVAAIRRNGELLLRLIDDILDLSRVEAHQLKMVTTEFLMNDLLADVEATLAPRAQQKGLQLKIGRLPEPQSKFRSDAIRLKQVLLNVLGNAIKFTDAGTVSLDLRLDPKYLDIQAPRQQRIIFEIRDSGLGIPHEDMAKLFQPFTQIDVSNRRRFGGSGLGLALSRQLAQSLGGDLKLLESELGKGSIFEISLVAEKLLPMKVAEPVPETIEEVPGVLKNKKILVVDDVSDNRALIVRYMKLSQATVLEAGSGQEAIDLVRDQDPDLILMDIQMPMMDGYEATQKIRLSGFNKPIVAWTAHAMKNDLSRCLAAGCNEIMTKPAKRRELVHLVTEFILHSRSA